MTPSIDDMSDAGIGSSSGISRGPDFGDQGSKLLSNLTPSIDDMFDGGIGSSSGFNRGSDFQDQGWKRLRNMTLLIDDMLDRGVGSSSRINRGPYNNLPEDCYNLCNQITKGTGQQDGDNGLLNSSTGNGINDGEDSGENGEQQISSKIKRTHKRHSKKELQVLNTFFKKESHPNEEQRKALGHELDLHPEKIKFWFQNKRTHVKQQDQKNSRTVLQEEKEMLIAQNKSLKEEHSNKHDLCQLCIGIKNPGELSEVRQLSLSNIVHRQQIKVMQEQFATSGGKELLFDSNIVLPLSTRPDYPISGEINGLINLLEPVQGPADPLEENHGPINSLEPIHVIVDPLEPIHVPVNQFEPIYEPVNQFEPIYEPVNQFKPVQGLVNPVEPIHEPVNQFEPIYEPVNQFESVQGLVNPVEPIHEPVNQFEPIHELVNQFEPIHVPVNQFDPIYEPVNQFVSIYEPVNQFEPIYEPINQFDPVQGLVNPVDPIHEPVNQFEPIHEPVNQFDHIHESLNQYDPIHEPLNSFESMHGPIHGHENPLEPVNGPVNQLVPVHEPASVPAPIYAHVNPCESVHVPTNIENKKMMIDLAMSAAEEFAFMAETNSSLWLSEEANSFVLNKEEYSRLISKETELSSTNVWREGSKESTIVKMTSNDIIKIFMNEKKWSTVFSDIVASATTLEVVSTGGQECYHNALHLVKAEFQVLSPLVPIRESRFLRCCLNNYNGTWTIVDVSLEDNWQADNLSVKYQRKPSGCLIKDLHCGYSMVTWVEHVIVDNQDFPDSYMPFIHSGLAFGAKRWTSILMRHYQHLTRFVQPNLTDIPNAVKPCTKGTKSMLLLAKRMVVSFHKGASSSIAEGWTHLLPVNVSGFYPIHLKVRKNVDDPGHPSGTLLSASSTFWLQASHERVFGYLKRQQYRHEWDVLSEGRAIEEIANIPSSGEEWNCLSLLRVYGQNQMLILQESHSDVNGSSITYSSFNYDAINAALEGWGNPTEMALLPCGFTIFPDGSRTPTGPLGSFVTISFQLLLSSDPDADISNVLVTNASNLIACVIGRIRRSLGC